MEIYRSYFQQYQTNTGDFISCISTYFPLSGMKIIQINLTLLPFIKPFSILNSYHFCSFCFYCLFFLHLSIRLIPQCKNLVLIKYFNCKLCRTTKKNYIFQDVLQLISILQFIIEAVVGGTQGRIAIDDIMVHNSTSGSCPPERECTFQGSLCGLLPQPATSFSWKRITGASQPANSSGPASDHTLGTDQGLLETSTNQLTDFQVTLQYKISVVVLYSWFQLYILQNQ